MDGNNNYIKGRQTGLKDYMDIGMVFCHRFWPQSIAAEYCHRALPQSIAAEHCHRTRSQNIVWNIVEEDDRNVCLHTKLRVKGGI
jgi:hypothetical protein